MPKPKVFSGKVDQSRTPQEVYQRTRPRGGIRASCTTGAAVPSESRLAINYILGDLFDYQYQSKS